VDIEGIIRNQHDQLEGHFIWEVITREQALALLFFKDECQPFFQVSMIGQIALRIFEVFCALGHPEIGQ